MTKFFSAWPLWEKLVFVLACGIVVTVLLGCAKLGHTHWKLRKYSAVAEKERNEQAMQRQMSQRSQRRRHADDVPFGIRAIESGIEVEGVWISRSNTPEPASRESSSNSMWDHVPRKVPQPDLEKQAYASEDSPAALESTADGSAKASFVLGRSASADHLPSSARSRDSSPDAPVTKPARSRHPPSTLAKYSTTPYLPSRHDSAISAIEGIDAIYRASGPLKLRESSSEAGDDYFISSAESNSGSNDIGPTTASAPCLLSLHSRPRHSSFDLDLMQSHRMSQAAEVGQLTPRVRKPGSSSERASIASTMNLNSTCQSVDHPNAKPKRSTTPDPYESTTNNSSSTCLPSSTSAPDVFRASMPDVTPFAQFCQTAPLSPRSETARLSGESSDTSRPINEPMNFSEPTIAASNVTTTDSALQEPEHVEQKRTSFEKRSSDVLRGHGSGFEILLPGSLKVTVPAEHPLEKQRAHPPLSLHKYSPRRRSSRSSSTESRRKLRKKRRPSMDSESSLESGRWSRASMAKTEEQHDG